MIPVSLLLILVAVTLLVLGLTGGSSNLLIGSIVASLLAAVALVIGARRAAGRRSPGAAGNRSSQPDDADAFVAEPEFAAAAASAADDRRYANPAADQRETVQFDNSGFVEQGDLSADEARVAARREDVSAGYSGAAQGAGSTTGSGPVADPGAPGPGSPFAADTSGLAARARGVPEEGVYADPVPAPRGEDPYAEPASRDDDRYVDSASASPAGDRYASAPDDRYASAEDGRYAAPGDGRYAAQGDDRYESPGDDRYASPDDDRLAGPEGAVAPEPDYGRATDAIHAARSDNPGENAWRRDPGAVDADEADEFAEPDDDDPTDEPLPQAVSPSDAVRVARLDAEVLVVDGRPRYHLPDCPHLVGRLTEPIPVNEAVELGFSPCGLCRPVSRLVAAAHL